MALRRGGSLISKVRQVSHRVFQGLLRQHGLTDLHPEQGKILFALMGSPGSMTIGEIGRQTLLKKSTLTTMLNRMEASGYLTKSPDPTDSRATLVCMTDKFRRQMDAYERVSAEMTAIYYKGFQEEEIDRFESMLERILLNLREYENAEEEEP